MLKRKPPDTNVQLNQLIDEIKTEFRDTAQHTGLSQLSPAVEQALRQVPRPIFVPERDRDYAFGNYPLPIGHNQTISQPYIVALMTEILDLTADSRVLEIGTGCGYQTAILAAIANKVYSVEILEPLATKAANHLKSLGYRNVHLRTGDGYLGWRTASPYDAIIVTACAQQPPPPLLAQLAPGGRMIIPLETNSFQQKLYLLFRDQEGGLHRRPILPVRFVPFTRA